MIPPAVHFRGFLLALLALGWGLAASGDHAPQRPSRLGPLPRTTLWAWERREDLRSLDARRFAVAYLDRTVTIGRRVESTPRRSPVWFPAAAVRIPVVRIEAPWRLAELTESNRQEAVEAILTSARTPGAALLQIDFDATRSQRAFYRALLEELRRRMPPELPLSITALASWCSSDRWMDGLPIDEAVPMLFQMEPDRRRPRPDVEDFRIREPLCSASAGLSLGEPWPQDLAGRRLYIFAERGWRGQPEQLLIQKGLP